MFRQKRLLRKVCYFKLCSKSEFHDQIYVVQFGEEKKFFCNMDGHLLELTLESNGGQLDIHHTEEPNILLLDLFFEDKKIIATDCVKKSGLWMPEIYNY